MKPIIHILLSCVLALGLAYAQPEPPADIRAVIPEELRYEPERSAHDRDTYDIHLRLFLGDALEDFSSRLWTFSYPGTLDELFAGLDVPEEAEVQEPSDQDIGMSLDIYASWFGELIAEVAGPEWVERAQARAEELAGVTQRTFQLGFSDPPIDGSVAVAPGTPVRLVMLMGSSPFFDLAELELVEGAYLHVLEATFTFPELDEDAFDEPWDEEFWDDEAWDEDFWDEDWTMTAPTEEELGVPLPPGTTWADYPYLGEDFFVEARLEEVLDFYLTLGDRYCSVAGETQMGPTAPAIYTLYCLEHPGELDIGDDVVEVIITTLPEDERRWLHIELPDEHTWLAFNRWIEEDY
jgi:hypothetical protein